MKLLFALLLICLSSNLVNAQACRTSCKNDIQFVQEKVEVQTGTFRCYPKFNLPCAPYACANEFACKTACSSKADCTSGYTCSSTGKCAPKVASCYSSTIVEGADGSQSDCSPYMCLSGQCRSNCIGDVDCSASHKCVSQRCQPR